MSAAAASPVVSVIIVCHNDGKWLPRCLESVRQQTFFDQLEIIIADNASSDGSEAEGRRLIESFPNARFLSTGGDHGFGVGCNHGAAAARGKYLFLLNTDVWLEPDCLQTFAEALERTGAAAAGGLVLEYDDQSIQTEAGTGFDFCGNAVATNPQAPELLCPACFFFIRRDAFLRVGGMDTKWFLYGEEMDLSWRLWIAGERIIPVRAARTHHRGAVNVNPQGGTRPTENRTSSQKRFLSNRNSLLFLCKNCQHFLLLLLFPSIGVIMLEGMVTLLMTRKFGLASATSLQAIAGAWALRRHILEQRRQIARYRRHGDFWMLRFFRLGFGRWGEVKKILKLGFPKIH